MIDHYTATVRSSVQLGSVFIEAGTIVALIHRHGATLWLVQLPTGQQVSLSRGRLAFHN